jgi:golgi-specific brefeldin A-resistance guanine nucleotide exchange factor 1
VEESMELGAVEGDDARIEAVLIKKRETWSVIDTFNHSPSKGVKSMIEKEIISSKEIEARSQELATTLREFAVVVGQNSLGDFFGGKDEFNLRVLEKYIDSFNFRGMALDDALRFFLSHFRLPGEGQMIDRIVQRFSTKFFEDNRGYHPQTTDAKKLSEWFEFQSSDAAYVLTFSIIMLNTDLHNPMVKRKMSVEDFVRNNARVTDSDQLPEAFLAKIYERTAQHELRVAPPIIDAHRYSYRWQEIVELSWKSCSLMSLTSLKHAFLSLWGPAMAAFSVTFDNSNATSLIAHASSGFMAAATAASHYRISEVVDKLIVALTKFTQVLSPISVHSSIQTFGKSRAAMQAARTVFDITKSHGDMIREGWREVLDLVLRMYNCGLMPADLRLAPPKNPTSSKPAFSLFNYFSSYSEEHLDAEENARKCVHECGIRELMSSDSKFLEAESLVFLIKALIFAATDALQNHDDANSAVVCLELLVRTVLSNRDRVLVVYDVVHEFFYRLFHFGCTHVGPANFVLEKTIQGILKVCTRLLPRDDLRDRLFKTFGILKDIPIVDLLVVGEGIYVKLVEGIHVLVDESGSLIR